MTWLNAPRQREERALLAYWDEVVQHRPAQPVPPPDAPVDLAQVVRAIQNKATAAQPKPYQDALLQSLLATYTEEPSMTPVLSAPAHPARGARPSTPARPHSGRKPTIPYPVRHWGGVALRVALILLLAFLTASGIWLFMRQDGNHQIATPPVATPTVQTSPDVPMYRGNPARTGVFPGPSLVGSPVELWTLQMGEPVNFGAAVVDGVLYLPAGSKGFEARDAMTGDLIWSFATKALAVSAPAVVDGMAYVADSDGTLYAVHAKDGTEAWQMANITNRSSVVPVNGIVYANSPEGTFYALDAATGSIRWQADLGGEAAGGMAVADGVAFQGNMAGLMTAFDAKTGEVKWAFQNEEGRGNATVTVANGQVYIAISGAPANALYAVDVATGKQTWRQEQPAGAGFISATATSTRLYSVAEDGQLHAMDAQTGETVWTYSLLEFVRSVPVLVEDTLYVIDNGGFVRAIDAETGTQDWEYPIQGEVELGWPVVANGVLYVGTNLGNFSAIAGSGMLAARLGSTPAAEPMATPGQTGQGDAVGIQSAVDWQLGGDAGTLGQPDGLAIAPDGTLWVHDVANAELHHIDRQGTVLESVQLNTVGAGTFDFSQRTGESYGAIAIDGDDNLYVLDMGNYRIVKLGPDRRFLLAFGSEGTGDGQFAVPDDVAVGFDGTVYVMDNSLRRVQHFTSDGEFLAAFGRDEPVGERLLGPAQFGVDRDGYVYVADVSEVKVFGPDGRFVRRFGAGDLSYAVDIAIDANGVVYVTDVAENLVKVFDAQGTLIGTIGAPGQFVALSSLAVDSNGGVYAIDFEGRSITKFTVAFTPPAGATPVAMAAPTLLWETTGADPGLSLSMNMAIAPDGTIWVSDGGHSQFQIFAPDGTYIESWGGAGRGSGDGQFNFTRANSNGDSFGAVAFAPDGSFYVADSGNNRIQHFDANRQFLNAWGSFGGGDGEFTSPIDIVVDGQGRVYVGDDRREDLQVFDASGTFVRKFGGNGDPEFQGLLLLAPDGTLWGADGGQHLLHQWSTDGELLRSIEVLNSDGNPVVMADVAFDPAGNMIVPDPDHARTLVLDPSGALRTEWALSDADLWSVITDDAGNLFVTTYGEHSVLQKYQLNRPPASTPVASPAP